MKRRRIVCWLTALVLLVSLLPAGTITASASGSGPRKVLIGLIEYLYNDLGDDFYVHYWDGNGISNDVPLQFADNDQFEKSVGPNYWNDAPQHFRLYLAELPEEAVGFKLWHPSTNRWFGNDGDALLHDRAFLFEYGGVDLALYESPVEFIAGPAEWSQLCADVLLGLDYAGRTVTMTASFSVGYEAVGDKDHPFRGCFNGAGNILDVFMQDPGTEGVAPFRCISDGAEIQNLNVTGTVVGGWHSAGLVGFCKDGSQAQPNVIDNCRVEVNVSGGDYNGGVVGHGSNSCLILSNTVYSGVLSDGSAYCGGLQGWGDSNELTINDCLFCGSYTGSGNFSPIAVGYGYHIFTNACYSRDLAYGSPEGIPVALSEPGDCFSQPATIAGIPVWFCRQTEIDGFNDWYLYDGTAHTISPVVRCDNAVLTEGVDYFFTIDGQNVASVTNRGYYEVRITGTGSYCGSVVRPVAVIDSLSGSGTVADPWLITDGADWIRFALDVESGNSFQGEYVKLVNDITLPVVKKVGTVQSNIPEYPFSGVFEGGDHLLCVNISDTQNQGTAPFCYLDGGTVQNLRVAGRVQGDYHTAGLVGFTLGSGNQILNCVVNVDVFSPNYLGGIVGHGRDADLLVDNCLFNGTLYGGSDGKGALLGWDDSGGNKTLTRCFYYCSDAQNTDHLKLAEGLSGSVILDHCYRTTDACEGGVRVYDYPLPDRLFGWLTAVDGAQFSLPCEISGVAAVYNCASGPVTLTPLVEFDGTALTEGVDYELDIVPVTSIQNGVVAEPGSYELHLNPLGGFEGLEIIPFEVGSVTWALEPDTNGLYTVLHISGVGPMEDLEPFDGFTGRYDIPAASMGDVRTVIIDVGITAIGDYAFDGFPNLERAVIPAGLLRVGSYAFTASGGGFTDLRLPPSLAAVEQGAFYGLSNVTDVWCGRSQYAWDQFVNGPDVELADNEILMGYNLNWQSVTYHYADLHNIFTNPCTDGSINILVENQPASQASDGKLVQVEVLPDPGYQLADLKLEFIDANGVIQGSASIFPLTAFTMPWDSDVSVTAAFGPIQYYVHYDANGGTGTMADQSFLYNVPQALIPNAFINPGYDFTDWNTTPDCNGAGYTDEEIVLNLSNVSGDIVTLYAQWSGWNYLVHFDPNGGAGGMPDQPFVYGSPQPLNPNLLNRTGYLFTGWNDAPNGTGNSYGDGEIVNLLPPANGGTVTLYAQWQPITYIVHYEPNDPTNSVTGTMADQIMTYDQPDNLLPNAFDVPGYRFTGWNEADDGSLNSYADRALVQNLTDVDNNTVTLFAQWTGWGYTVRFRPNNSNASGIMPNQHFSYGTPQALAQNAFSLPGYHFIEWNDDAGGVGTGYTDAEVIDLFLGSDNAVLTLYAQWAPNDYTVRFDANDATNSYTGSMPDQPFTYDVQQNLFANQYSRTGYIFSGWNTDPNGLGRGFADGAAVVNLTPGENDVVILYAQWTPITYTVHFASNGGAGNMADQVFTYDTTGALSPNAFTLAGYSFNCWVDGNGIVYTDQAPVWNLSSTNGAVVVLTAQWTPNNYVIQFAPNAPVGSYSGSMPDQPFTYGQPQNLNPNLFNRTGYTFLGWGTAPSGPVAYSNGATVNIPASNGQTVILYAQWRANTYIVHFDANSMTVPGGTSGTMADQSFTYDQWQNLSRNRFTCNNQYYYFVGWCEDIEGLIPPIYTDEEAVINLTDVDGGVVTLYAIWRPIHFTVRYHGNGAPNPDYTQVFYYDSPEDLEPNQFVYPGYGFLNWNTRADGLGTTYPSVYQINNTFFANNGINNTNFRSYRLHLYAQWGPSHYNVVFDPNGGTGGPMPDQPFTYGVSAPLDRNLYTRPGYRFAGWNTEHDGSGTSYTDTQTVLNLTSIDGGIVFLFAQWEPFTYIIRFLPNATVDEVMLDQHLVYDTPRQLIANAYTRRGYRFDGWNTAYDGSGTPYANQALVNFLPSYDGEIFRLFAQWKPNTYSVIFDPNGGTGNMPNQTLTYDQYGTLHLNVFTRRGYLFTGWNTATDGSGRSYADGATVANLTAVYGGSVTLYAQWRPISYTVVYDRNGAFLGRMQPQTLTYDQPANLTPNGFYKPDCIFDHWSTSPGDDDGSWYADRAYIPNITDVDGATVTLYAQWAPRYWAPVIDAFGCTVSTNPSSCLSGTQVTISAEPYPDCEFKSITAEYYDEEGTPYTLDLEQISMEEYIWTFFMPVGEVHITVIFANPHPFDDVPEDAWYADAVRWAVENGITAGTSESTFSPFDACTRAQIVTLLWRSAGSPWTVNSADSLPDDFPFHDVPEGAWYTRAVLWAWENSVTAGVSEHSFGVKQRCTRAQIVTFLWRYAGSPASGETDLAFDDVPPDAWYADAVRWAAANGITTGTSETTFSPNKTCTRAEVVTFLYHYFTGA